MPVTQGDGIAHKGSRRRFGNGTPTLPSLEEPPEIRRINRSVMRAEWSDPDDLRPNVRSGRMIAGHRAYCPLRWCIKRHGARSQITEAHLRAADQLRAQFDGSRIGFMPLHDDPTPVGERDAERSHPQVGLMRQDTCRGTEVIRQIGSRCGAGLSGAAARAATRTPKTAVWVAHASTDLSGADLSQADLSDAYLGGAYLGGADLHDAQNVQQQDEACGTDAKLPPRLTLKPCPPK